MFLLTRWMHFAAETKLLYWAGLKKLQLKKLNSELRRIPVALPQILCDFPLVLLCNRAVNKDTCMQECCCVCVVGANREALQQCAERPRINMLYCIFPFQQVNPSSAWLLL